MLTSPQAMSFEFLTTPILLIATTAKDLFNAMYAHPATRVARDFIRRVKQLTTYTFSFKEYDGATGNDKLFHHAFSLVANGDKMAACVCRNHCTIICEQGVLLVGGKYQELREYRQPRCLVTRPELLFAGLIMLSGAGAGCCGGACACRYPWDLVGGFCGRLFPVQNDLFCCAQFLRTGGNFARLFVGTPCLRDKVHIRRGVPPAEACSFAEEMKQFLIAAFRRERAPSKDALDKYSAKVHRFFHILNGRAWLPYPEIFLVGEWDMEGVLASMETCVRDIILPQMPTVPSANKWTKTAPAVRFQNTANLFGIFNIQWGKPCAASPRKQVIGNM